MTESQPDPQSPRDDERPAEGLGEKLGHAAHAVGDAVGRVEERVEHAAEDVAQEVAEHVPATLRRPVRWTIQKLILVSALVVMVMGLVVVAGTVYYVWNHTEWASHEVTWRVNQVLRAHSDLELSVGGLRGNPLSRVEVIAPRVGFRDRMGPPLLEARSMTLRYSTWDLFTAKRGALVIELDRPVARLARGVDGRLRIPEWRTGAAARRPGRGFDYLVRIRDGDLVMPEPEASIQDFDLEAAVATGGGTSVEIRSLAWRSGFHGLALRRLRGSVVAADSVVVRVDELSSSDLVAAGEARWDRDQGPKLLSAEVARVRWTWLSRVFQNNTLDVPGEGRFSIQAREEGGWTGAMRSRATWDGLPIESEASFAWREGRLTLDLFSGRSRAGDLTEGRLHWSKLGWDVSGTARGADPAQWGVIGLRDWPQGSLNGRFRYAVDTRARPDAELEARLAPSEWSGWRVDSALVRIEFPPVAADSFQVAAVRRGGRMELHGRIAPGGWVGRYSLLDFPLDEWPDGRATGLTGTLGSGNGTIEGRQGGLWVTGDLEGRSTRWLGMEANRWRLDRVEGRLLPTPELDARAQLLDVLYLGIHFDSASAPIHLGDQTLEMPALTATASDTVLTMTAQAEWREGSWRLTADQAAVRSRSFAWTAEEPIRLAGDARGVTFERLVARDQDARLEVEGRWAVPGGSYDWRGRASGLHLDRLGLPADLRLGGVADAELVVRGPSGDPRWDLTLFVQAPASRGRQVDSVHTVLAGAPSRLDVRELRVKIGDGWLEGRGEIAGMAHAWPDSLTPSAMTSWIASAGRWRGEGRAQSLQLDRAARLLGIGQGVTGLLDGTFALGGRPREPEFQVALRASPMAWRTLRLDEVTAGVRYENDRLQVESLRATRDATVSEITGEMEIQLGLGRRSAPLDAPMTWRVRLPNGDLALLPLLVPQIGSASGRFVVDGQVAGTPRRPQLQGTARIEEGRVRMAGREEVLQNVRAQLTFEAARVVLESLTAEQNTRDGNPGKLSARGALQFPENRPPTYRFEVALRGFTAIESGVYAARFDGDFVVADGHRAGKQTLPHVTSDNVEIDRAVILYDFAGQSEAQRVEASTQPLYWTYRLRLHATDNLRWQPPDGDIEFSADLSLEQTPEELVIFGDMEALRGTYWFLDNRFTVRRAVLTFDDVRGVDPVVDAEAATRLVPVFAATRGETPEPHDITVVIQGRASAPSVEFRSEPSDLDEAEILRELTVGRFTDDPSAGLRLSADPFDSYLTRIINRQLSQELSRAFRGYLSDWEIARESGGVLGGQGGVIIGVGSQLNSQIAVRYRQRLPGTGGTTVVGLEKDLFERDLEAEYRINRYFYITSQLTQKRTVAGTTSESGAPDFNINLKARWEY